ncbi:YoaK family protein [Tundrisphaera sp. TA3]|uniref:YoaK family protein n=1 Tax=Tundrisphaera sp. TA3 TaxID=3435775 RepID=UPI003EB7D223
MRTDVFKEVTAQRNQALWLLLGFQSGFMNAGGFLACHQFVSHMTGYGTTVGVSIGTGDYIRSFELALAPLFFLAGAAYAGWLVDRRLILGLEPRLEAGILTLAIMNVAVFVGDASGLFGPFGEPLVMQRDFLLLFCLCFACGLQNGLFTGLTEGKVRTTHMTGPTTDIGLTLAKVFTLHRGDPERGKLTRLNLLRVKIVVAFSGGSLIAALVFQQITFEGFAIPAATSLFVLWYVRRLLRVGGPESPDQVVQSLLIPDEPSHAAKVG